MDLDKLVLEAGVALRGVPVASIGSEPRAIKHPQHANHIGYVIQVKYPERPNVWYWWEDDHYDPFETFEAALTAVKEKQLDWPNATYRIVGIVEVS